jgi:hypothetical protein
LFYLGKPLVTIASRSSDATRKMKEHLQRLINVALGMQEEEIPEIPQSSRDAQDATGRRPGIRNGTSLHLNENSSPKSKKAKKCSLCHQEGHNCRNCPNK